MGLYPSPGAFGETFGGPSDRGTDQNSYLGHANLPQRRERWWLSWGHIVGWGYFHHNSSECTGPVMVG